MTDKVTHTIEHWLAVLNAVTKEEGDAFLTVLNWDHETRVAFRIAKKMYDDNFMDKEHDYECPDPIRSYKAKLRITDDSV